MLPAASPPPTLSGLFLYFAGFFTSLFLSCRFHQVRFPGNQRLLNIPLSMILLSCLSVLTLSCGNLLNSALTYGDFLKITNLLIIIIKKHLTGGNSTSKLYGMPQREEGRSATLSNTGAGCECWQDGVVLPHLVQALVMLGWLQQFLAVRAPTMAVA